MKTFSVAESKQKIYRYCAYQERSHQEVRSKLYTYGLRTADVEEILTQLITEGYLNEERYAKAFAGGKFRMKQWGRNRIAHTLESKGISRNCIKSGLREIDESTYRATLKNVLQKQAERGDTSSNIFSFRDKLAQFAIRRGFEPDLVWEVLREMLPG
ncbi:MAG: RecX family transcriptional regulator [Bacteroidia bacterium]|nr:RecX family transcriptional regulator [Bacteroidia bacterium]